MAVPRWLYIAFLVPLLLGVCSSHRCLSEGKDHRERTMESGEACLEQGENINLTKADHHGNISHPLAEATDSHHGGIEIDCKKCKLFKGCKSCINGNTSLTQPMDSDDNDDDDDDDDSGVGCKNCPFAACKRCAVTIDSEELSVEAKAPESG